MAKAEIVEHQEELIKHSFKAPKPDLYYIVVEKPNAEMKYKGQLNDYLNEPSVFDSSKHRWTDVTDEVYIKGVGFECVILACDRKEVDFLNKNRPKAAQHSSVDSDVLSAFQGDSTVERVEDMNKERPYITGAQLWNDSNIFNQ